MNTDTNITTTKYINPYFGGVLFANLHTICTWALFISEVRFAAHLREICTVLTNVYEHWTWVLFISEVRFSHTSIRSAQFLQLLMRFGGARDLGLYNTKQGSDDTSMAKEGPRESCPTLGSEF